MIKIGNEIKLEQKYIDSREVAEMVGKEHSKLLRDIRVYSEQLGQSKIGQSDFFTESTYQNSQNKTQPCYLITKKGCEFIAHKLTGARTRNTKRFSDGHCGVGFHKRDAVWFANIRVNGELKHLGNYETEIDAINARKEAELKYYGKYC